MKKMVAIFEFNEYTYPSDESMLKGMHKKLVEIKKKIKKHKYTFIESDAYGESMLDIIFKVNDDISLSEVRKNISSRIWNYEE